MVVADAAFTETILGGKSNNHALLTDDRERAQTFAWESSLCASTEENHCVCFEDGSFSASSTTSRCASTLNPYSSTLLP